MTFHCHFPNQITESRARQRQHSLQQTGTAVIFQYSKSKELSQILERNTCNPMEDKASCVAKFCIGRVLALCI